MRVTFDSLPVYSGPIETCSLSCNPAFRSSTDPSYTAAGLEYPLCSGPKWIWPQGKKVAFYSKKKRFWTKNELQPRKVQEGESGEAVIQFLLSLRSLERSSLLLASSSHIHLTWVVGCLEPFTKVIQDTMLNLLKGE